MEGSLQRRYTWVRPTARTKPRQPLARRDLELPHRPQLGSPPQKAALPITSVSEKQSIFSKERNKGESGHQRPSTRRYTRTTRSCTFFTSCSRSTSAASWSPSWSSFKVRFRLDPALVDLAAVDGAFRVLFAGASGRTCAEIRLDRRGA